jgi:hypothetical protein
VLGAALYGAILNYGLHLRAPGAVGLIDRLMDPVQRQQLGSVEVERLTGVVAASLHDVYWVSTALAVAALVFALRIPTGLKPQSQAPAGRQVK